MVYNFSPSSFKRTIDHPMALHFTGSKGGNSQQTVFSSHPLHHQHVEQVYTQSASPFHSTCLHLLITSPIAFVVIMFHVSLLVYFSLPYTPHCLCYNCIRPHGSAFYAGNSKLLSTVSYISIHLDAFFCLDLDHHG